MTTPPGWGEDSAYWVAGRNRFIAAISQGLDTTGKRILKVVSGKTQGEVKAKLKKLADELESDIRNSGIYTVQNCLDDFLTECLSCEADGTVENYGHMARYLTKPLGKLPLKDLSARNVSDALTELAPDLPAGSLRLVNQILVRAIRHAQVNDLVDRNVAGRSSWPK
jgi:hypothetical protein